MTTIAQIADVRTAGGLLAHAQGGATDAQITAALASAQQHMIGLVTKAAYIAVRDYAGADTDELAKQEAHKQAEARFAMSFLPTVLTSSQLQETGYKTESQIGKTTTRFGNADDISFISDFWAREASVKIAPYLDLSYLDDDDEEMGIETADQSITMISI